MYGTIYSIFAFYMRTVQSDFKNLLTKYISNLYVFKNYVYSTVTQCDSLIIDAVIGLLNSYRLATVMRT